MRKCKHWQLQTLFTVIFWLRNIFLPKEMGVNQRQKKKQMMTTTILNSVDRICLLVTRKEFLLIVYDSRRQLVEYAVYLTVYFLS